MRPVKSVKDINCKTLSFGRYVRLNKHYGCVYLISVSFINLQTQNGRHSKENLEMIRVISSCADGPVNFNPNGPAEDQTQKLISSTVTVPCYDAMVNYVTSYYQ